MYTGPRLLLLLPIAALLGCGSSSSGPSGSTTSTAYDFNGDWGAVALSAYPQAMPFDALEGVLQVSTSGAVTGTVTPFVNYTGSNPNLCAAVNTPLAVTGTLDAAHDLNLTFPIAGGTGTLVATLADNPQTYASGTWQIDGGACAMSVTAMAIKGSNPVPAPTTPVPITANLSGNWATHATSNPGTFTVTQTVAGFGGDLQFSNGTVTGTLTASVDANAITCAQNIGGASPVAGTLDASNNLLTLTLPVAGGEATITATLGSNLQTLADGSYQIVGGDCAMSATPMTIAQYTPLTGTYTGIFNVPNLENTAPTPNSNVPEPGSNITVTAVLTQSAPANASGAYPVTGNVTVTGACTDNSIPFTGTVTGSDFAFISGPAFTGTFDPTASAIYNASYSSANCPVTLEGASSVPVPYQGILTQ